MATKSTSGIYNDNLALLTMELVNMGLSQEAVGKVMKACTTRLAGRTLDSVVSCTTAGRIIRRGGILSDAQVAMELESNASRGVRVGLDTTTRRGTEHVSTVWGGRKMALCATYSLGSSGCQITLQMCRQSTYCSKCIKEGSCWRN